MGEKPCLSLAGRTLRWTFPGGPTGNAIYEHDFRADGTVEWRQVGGGAQQPPSNVAKEKQTRYESFEVAAGLHLVSYLAESGYTLTVLVNLNDGVLHGFASNDKQWYPLVGTLSLG